MVVRGLAVLLPLTLVWVGVVAAGPPDRLGAPVPIVADQDLPPDVVAEVNDTWQRFATSFPARVDCFGEVGLRLVERVDGGDARYLVAERRIEIEIPTSPRRFRESLAHELAHHLEHTCPAFDDVRSRFAALPGVPAGPWDRGERWERIPSELWAETVVAVVNGERDLHGNDMPLPAGAERLAREWGQGPDARA